MTTEPRHDDPHDNVPVGERRHLRRTQRICWAGAQRVGRSGRFDGCTYRYRRLHSSSRSQSSEEDAIARIPPSLPTASATRSQQQAGERPGAMTCSESRQCQERVVDVHCRTTGGAVTQARRRRAPLAYVGVQHTIDRNQPRAGHLNSYRPRVYVTRPECNKENQCVCAACGGVQGSTSSWSRGQLICARKGRG